MLKIVCFSDFAYHAVFSKYVLGTVPVHAIMLMQYDPLCCAESRSFSYAQGLTSNI